MSRAYIIYIVMFAVLIGGLWLILTIGASLEAPDDLAGDWTVAWDGPPPLSAGDASMHVSQSGRFFVIRFGEKPPLSLTLRPGWKGARDGRMLQMQLASDIWKMSLRGDIPLGESARVPQVQVELDGPTRYAGVARRNGSPASRPAGVARAR